MSDTGSTLMLRARGLRREYGREAALVRAVDGVDLDVATGETLAVPGPHGRGKATPPHLLRGLDPAPAGGPPPAGPRLRPRSQGDVAKLGDIF